MSNEQAATQEHLTRQGMSPESTVFPEINGETGNRSPGSPGLLGGQIADIFRELSNSPISKSSFVNAIRSATSLIFHGRENLTQVEFKALLAGLVIALDHPKWWHAISTNPANDGSLCFFLDEAEDIGYFESDDAEDAEDHVATDGQFRSGVTVKVGTSRR